ncbi:unnamed protein product (macronuclear) [Paramecium tetraurelia]|uniref:Calcium-dependent protein kinase 1 n=1 Tax=Paramecium tetraurelia TaxID=5888 RepID=A0DE93_PARTE|nr:uncharacterized protein GSPATT00016202001 [Paramecium tetraurelia]CAK81360.1 unnamed protein product [Paramecium tetraurelia]|eukprot:XP_001448757.1 hypothetical protein (macronuclear) [Paramecium tetraurelia strain d4-2]
MKQVRKENAGQQFQENEKNTLLEANILKELDHPNIFKLHELFQDEKNYYLITEYLEGEELFDKITNLKHLTEKMAADYMRQILGAVVHCHEKKIVHRDLKPENIIFSSKKPNSNLKIIDFGSSCKIENNQFLTKKCGVPYFIAPEILKRNYNEKCDVWSCGVILYIMLCGYPPFGGEYKEILQKVEIGKYEFDYEDWDTISNDAKNLINKMLTMDFTKRISAQEALNDPWIQKNAPIAPCKLEAIKNLNSFFCKNKVRAALMQFISTNLMTNEEKEVLLQEFRKIDKDGNGQINKEDLILGKHKIIIVYMQQYNDIKANQMVDQIFEKLDTNKSGIVDYTEFITAAVDEEKLLNKFRLRQAFSMFDLNGDGYINEDDFKEFSGGNNENFWNELLALCDSNGRWLDFLK